MMLSLYPRGKITEMLRGINEREIEDQDQRETGEKL